jgi:transcription initiation factor TFIID subunit 13
MILFAHGDVRDPLPETVRVFDEILTDFMQSIAFEAARAAQYSGRQKIKYEDFEFAFRKNPTFLGKVQETFEKSKEIKRVRDIMQTDESALAKEVAEEEKAQARNAPKSKAADEELGEADDDADAQMDAIGKKR